MKLLKLRLTCSDAGWLLAWAGACGLAILFATSAGSRARLT
jgi:hypothetical protein